MRCLTLSPRNICFFRVTVLVLPQNYGLLFLSHLKFLCLSLAELSTPLVSNVTTLEILHKIFDHFLDTENYPAQVQACGWVWTERIRREFVQHNYPDEIFCSTTETHKISIASPQRTNQLNAPLQIDNTNVFHQNISASKIILAIHKFRFPSSSAL